MDYSEIERELYDGRQSDVQKVWIVVLKSEEDVYPYDDDMEMAIKGAEMYKEEYPNEQVLVGWIWDSELSGNFKHTWKNFNPINIEPEDLKQAV